MAGKQLKMKGRAALTHIDREGEARMVDVSAKPATERVAVAQGRVLMSKATLDLIISGDAKKGDVLGTARVAGIMAAKRTADLIPLCHPARVVEGHPRHRARARPARLHRPRHRESGPARPASRWKR